MTPKSKAALLVLTFMSIVVNMKLSKECALELVKQIIDSNPHSNPLNTDLHSTMDYWMEVKEEIEKL